MIYTNKTNLNKAFYLALSKDPYKKVGHYTASELPTPPQIWALRQRYRDKIKVDVSDLIYALVGNNTHYILERCGVKNALTEERFSAVVGLWEVTGKIDFYYDLAQGVLEDYKITTIWTVIDGVKPEWECQINVNKYLMEQNGFKVSKANINCIFRDWSKIKAMKDPNYPTKKQVAVLPVRLWDTEDIESWILFKISVFEIAKKSDDDSLPLCTPEERWAKPDKWAVIKKGAKRATKLFEDENKANALLEAKGDKYEIQFRTGESTRCEYYCEVKDFCHQYKKIKGESNGINSK